MPSFRLNASASLDAAQAASPLRERRIEIVAYTGGKLPVSGFEAPVVVDYAGLVLPASVPLLADHEDDIGSIIGQATSLVLDAGRLVVAGVVIPHGDAAKQVLALHDSGFAWQASIGAAVDEVEGVPAGKTVVVNGQEFTGPVCVARAATLREVSLVAVGADAHTSAYISAKAALKGIAMSFEDWVKSLGLDAVALDDATRAGLMKAYEQATAAATPPAVDASASAPAAAGNAQLPAPTMTASVALDLTASRKAQSAEFARVLKIQRMCASHPELGEKAIAEGWHPDQVELHILRAGAKHGRDVKATSSFRGTTPASGRVLEAALCQAGRLKGVEKQYDDATLQAAHTAFKGRISLQQFLLEAAWANGCDERHLSTTTCRKA